MNLLPVYGPNTKQWLIYDEDQDIYLDPPSEVLDKLKEDYPNDMEAQENALYKIIEEFPSWLYEYKVKDIEI